MSFLRVVRGNWPLILVMVAFCMALIFPDGGKYYKPLVKPLIMTLLALLGFATPLMNACRGARALHVHVLLQFYSLLMTPIGYYFLVYRWRWEVTSGILAEPFAQGLLAELCMPGTHATSLIFCQQAGGDTAVAAVSSSIGSLVGSAIAPFVAGVLLIGSNHSSSSSGEADVESYFLSTLSKLSEEVILPFAGGLAAQLACHRLIKSFSDSRPWVSTWFGAVLSWLKHLTNLVLFLLIYLIFAHTMRDDDLSQYGAINLCKLVAYVLAVHLVIIAGAWLCALPLSPRRRVAFVLTAPQKTESLALAILAVIFVDSPYPQALLALPVILYHTLQMLVAALIVPLLRRWVDRKDPQSLDVTPVLIAGREALLPHEELYQNSHGRADVTTSEHSRGSVQQQQCGGASAWGE